MASFVDRRDQIEWGEFEVLGFGVDEEFETTDVAAADDARARLDLDLASRMTVRRPAGWAPPQHCSVLVAQRNDARLSGSYRRPHTGDRKESGRL
jgi:hypothetical protein